MGAYRHGYDELVRSIEDRRHREERERVEGRAALLALGKINQIITNAPRGPLSRKRVAEIVRLIRCVPMSETQ